jgi:thimet oligopeptidase
VKFYTVFDSKKNERIGSFYLDLFPREGKYSHASAYPVVDGFFYKNSRNFAIATMVANFTKPTATKPSLLTHREVITLFHEVSE